MLTRQGCRSDGDRRGCFYVGLTREGGMAIHDEVVLSRKGEVDDLYIGEEGGGA